MKLFFFALLLSFSNLLMATELKTGPTSRPALLGNGYMATQDNNCNILLIDTLNHVLVDSTLLPNCSRGEFSNELLYSEGAIFSLSFTSTKENITYTLHRFVVKINKLDIERAFTYSVPRQAGVLLRPTQIFLTAKQEIGFLINARNINSVPLETTFISVDRTKLTAVTKNTFKNTIIEVSAFDKAGEVAYFASLAGDVFRYAKGSFSKISSLPVDSFKEDLTKAGFNSSDYSFRVQGINLLADKSLVVDANAGIYVISLSNLKMNSVSAFDLGQLSKASGLFGLRGGWGSKSITSPDNKNALIPFYHGYFSLSMNEGQIALEKLSVKEGYSLNKPNGVPSYVNSELIYYQVGNEIAYFKKQNGNWISVDSSATNIRTPGSSSWILYSDSHIWVGYIHPALITAHTL
jgi:hypothetical protein